MSRIVSTRITPYRLRLLRPLRTGRGGFVYREGFLVGVRDAAGRCGAGDAAPWPGFGSSPAAVQAACQALAGQLTAAPQDVVGIAALLQASDWPVEVKYAVELALLDLLGQAQGVPVAQLLDAAPRTHVAVHALVPNAASAQEAVRAGATHIKVKVGAGQLDEDVMRVGAIRAAVGQKVALRLDANGAWSVPTAIRAVKLLSAFSPEWIEQPVDSVPGLRAVRDVGAMPVAADESAHSAAGLAEVLGAEAADVVILKPMFTGGLLAARALSAQAQAHGVRGVVTHAMESAVGRQGALHLAATLPAEACGLGNPLSEDVAEPTPVEGGMCARSAGPGLDLVWRGAAPC